MASWMYALRSSPGLEAIEASSNCIARHFPVALFIRRWIPLAWRSLCHLELLSRGQGEVKIALGCGLLEEGNWQVENVHAWRQYCVRWSRMVSSSGLPGEGGEVLSPAAAPGSERT